MSAEVTETTVNGDVLYESPWKPVAERFSKQNGGCVTYIVDGKPMPAPEVATDIFPRREEMKFVRVHLDYAFYPPEWRYRGPGSLATEAANRAAKEEAAGR